MRVGRSHLTYCMNVHPGEALVDTLRSLRGPALGVKSAIAPRRPFGVGLRMAAQAASELQDPERLAELQRVSNDLGMYAFTVNGFPYGAFHGQPVKRAVYLPNWSTAERVSYTQQAAQALSQLLPPGVNGTVSTVPLGYGDATEREVAVMVNNVLSLVKYLWELEQRAGVRVTLALEPEPDCLLQTSADVVSVFERHFYGRDALIGLGVHCGVSIDAARDLCARYLGVCLDTCHAAVEFEAAADVVGTFRKHGITIAKVQLSSGLRVPACDAEQRAALTRFDEPVYLHQVVVRRADGQLVRYPDLGDALRLEASTDAEWRVHFHVPLHVAEYPLLTPEFGSVEPNPGNEAAPPAVARGASSGANAPTPRGRLAPRPSGLSRAVGLGSTRSFVEELLLLHQAEAVSEHFEVETYTWDVLPERPSTIVESITQELTWVLAQL